MFLLIAFTPHAPHPEEPLRIRQLLDSGFSFVHLRHPEMDIDSMSALLRKIPREYHPQIRLHSNFGLVREFDLAGIQLNSRCKTAPDGARSVTLSCHNANELDTEGDFLYFTLSPVYPSISKPGYSSVQNFLDIGERLYGKTVVALGGVSPDRFRELEDAGFSGAAMLGDIWRNAGNNREFTSYLKTINTHIQCCSS